MYLCQSRLGPGAYQVTSYAGAARVSRSYWFVPARVSRGYMVCARACVTWFHGLCDGQRPPQGAGETSSARTTCQYRYLDRVKMNVAQYRMWPDAQNGYVNT